MKSFFLIPVIAFLTVCNLHAQKGNLEFNRLNTRKQTLKGFKTSEIYSILLPNAEKISNPVYTKLKNELEIALTDSVSKSTVYSKALDRFNDISSIKNKVSAFIVSDKPLGNKLVLLKEAQILALKQNIEVLLYSDNSTNKKQKAGFLVLKFKPENMKLHLNKVLLKLDNLLVVPEQPNYNNVALLRGKLEQTNKTKAVVKAKHKKGYMLEKVIAPENISGDYLELGRYFVLNGATKGFSKGQLITQKTFLNYHISKSKLNFNRTKILIKNKNTEEMYLVDNNFLNDFSIKS